MENLVVAFVGVVIGGLGAYFWVHWSTHGWIFKSCANEGPDFIKKKMTGKLLLGVALAVLVCVLLWTVDALFFSRPGTLYELFHHMGGGPGHTRFWLWGPMIIGSIGGSVLGHRTALSHFPKCRHLFR